MKKICFLLLAAHGLWHITFSQNVGIGTISPQAKLEVKKPVKSDLKISSNDYKDTTQLIFSNRTAGNQGTDIILSSNRENGLWFSSKSDLPGNNYDSIMIILPTGKVGLNNTTPAEILDVKGNINFSGALKTNGNSGSTGQVLTSTGTGSPAWQTVAVPKIGFTARGTAPAITNHQNIATGVDTKVSIFNVEESDDGNLYDPATARATVPSDGLYHIDISINYPNADAGLYQLTFHRLSSGGMDLGEQRLVRNTVPAGVFNEDIQLNISADFYLFANQSVEVYAFQNSGVGQQITGSFFSWFNMHKIY